MGINKDLGLPFGEGMQKVAIAFDVDGTLIFDDVEVENTTQLLLSLLNQPFKNVDIIIWSGGGADYAEGNVRRHLGNIANQFKYYSKLQHKEVRERYDLIIAIDDVQDTRLGDVNLIVRNK